MQALMAEEVSSYQCHHQHVCKGVNIRFLRELLCQKQRDISYHKTRLQVRNSQAKHTLMTWAATWVICRTECLLEFCN